MDTVLRSPLEDVKKALGSFRWWIEKIGTTVHKGYVIMAADVLEP